MSGILVFIHLSIMLQSTKAMYAGTSGLVLPYPKSQFPEGFENKTRLTYYASVFNSLEVNSSFYKIPLARTIEKWTTEVPANFRFTFKLWEGITHVKELNFNAEDVNTFIQNISSAKNNNGCLLIQFPPGLRNTHLMQLEKLLAVVEIADAAQIWKTAVEFRNKSWYNDETYHVLKQYKAALVLQDLPASVTPFTDQDEDIVYVRFHGPNGGYRGSYTDDVLEEYAGYIKDWLALNKTVYVYFNNTIGGAFNNVVTLNKLV